MILFVLLFWFHWALFLRVQLTIQWNFSIKDSVGSLWNWGRRMLGTYWNSWASVRGILGRVLNWSNRGCHGRDGCWDAIRMTVVPRDFCTGSFWALWEPGERRKSGPNRPKIGTGRLPPMLCRRGRAKRRWASLCSPLLRTYRSGESRRHKTVCLRLLVEDAIPLGWADWDETEHRRLHSWRREDVWVWELSGTDPVIGKVRESCETELWNEFRLVSECTPPRYCCRSIPGLSDDSIVGPSEVGLDEWLLIPANWCGVWILVGTKLRKAVVSANWLPSPWEMHLWRRRDWGPADVTGHPSSRRDEGTNGGMRGTPNRAWLECPMTDDVESIGPWTRVGGNVDGDVHGL